MLAPSVIYQSVPAVYDADRTLSACSNTFAVRQNEAMDCMIAVAYVSGDKKRRVYLSTATPVPVPTVERKSGDKTFSVPTIFDQYNKRMFGVDLSNQYAAMYSPWRRSQRWWLPIVLHYFHVAVVNAYLLYSAYGAESLPSLEFSKFRERLAEELTVGFTTGRTVIGRPPKQSTGKHEHVETDEQFYSGRRKNGLCSVCAFSSGSRGNQTVSGHRTSWICKQCSWNPSKPIWVCHVDTDCWVCHLKGTKKTRLNAK